MCAQDSMWYPISQVIFQALQEAPHVTSGFYLLHTPLGHYVQLWFHSNEKKTAWEATLCLKDLISAQNSERKLLKLWHDHPGEFLLQKNQDGWILLTKTTALDTVKVVCKASLRSQRQQISPECIYPMGIRDPALVTHNLCEHREIFFKRIRQIRACLTSHHDISHNTNEGGYLLQISRH